MSSDEQIRPYHVGICGSYGGMNLGDEAILESIICELRQRLPVVITVFSNDPEDTLERHRVERAVRVRRLSRAGLTQEIRALDLLVLGGGGILYDGEAAAMVRPAQIAHEMSVPAMTWAVGAGPLVRPAERAAVQRALEGARLITVRDHGSGVLLEDIGITRDIHVTADPALLLEPAPFTAEMLRDEGVAPGACLVGMSIREPGPAAPGLDEARYHELLANVIDYLARRMGATTLFIPMEQEDLRQAHGVAARVAHVQRHLRILQGQYSARQVRGLMSRLRFAIGMRLHFLLFAASAGVPFVALPYGAKISELVDELDMSMPPIQAMNTGQLLAAIDEAWHLREELQDRLVAHTERLVERAAQTATLAADLLRATRLDRGAP